MPKPSATSRPVAPLDNLSFEDALAQVESIIARVEAGDVGLEQSLVEYERGVRLINHCRATLGRAQQQIEDLTRKLDGAAGPDDKSPPPASRAAPRPADTDDEDLPV